MNSDIAVPKGDRIISKILIVDDEATDREILKRVLSGAEEAYEVRKASSGKSALEIIEKDTPDIILLDVMMPGMNGFEICGKLKADKKYKSIPIIFITCMGDTEDKVTGFRMGAADYIMKPVNSEELKARVATHLKIKRLEDERVEAEKLKTVKDMIATYNHNMNQPLMAAYIYIDLLMTKISKADKNFQTLEKTKKELDKTKSILQKIQSIDKVERTSYVDKVEMVDLEKSTRTFEDYELQLIHASRIATIGEMSASLIHEMRQPLMVIAVHMEVLLMHEVVSQNEKLKEKMEKIREQFNRIGKITERLSGYFRFRCQDMKDDDINIPIKDSLFLLKHHFNNHDVNVALELDSNIPQLYFDKYQIQDVLINFLLNATDAIDEVYHQDVGGQIKIFSKVLNDIGIVSVGVVDNGKPIDRQVEEKMFDPFFTTKGYGKGTGLGLSVSKNIIKSHKGVMNFIELGGKKMFYFALPLDKNKNLDDDKKLMVCIEKKLGAEKW